MSLVRFEGRDGIGMVDQGNVLRYLPSYFSLDLGVDYSFKLLRKISTGWCFIDQCHQS